MPQNSKPKRPVKPDNIRSWEVKNEGETLFQFMTGILKVLTKTKVKSMLRHTQFAINSMPTTQYDAPLSIGDRVSVNFDRSFKVFSHPRIKLVYEDDDIIVINKGYGILSMGTDKIKDGTAYSVVREYVKYSNPKAHVYIVHRLDRDTSGLMMLAKTEVAKETMQHNWNNMVLKRKYIAVVEGAIEKPEGVVRSYLAENAQFEVYSTQNPEEGQLSVTRYTTLKSKNGYSMLELELDTGRKNQIRVHMKDIDHPIVGDRKYGAKSSPINRLALHAQTLRFVHPISRKDMNFETPIPTRFRNLVK